MATTTPPTQTQPLPKEKEKEREKESSKLELNRDLMKSFRPARIFKAAVESTPQLPNGRPGVPRHITGISFDDTGEFVLTAAEDDNYRFYACRSGKSSKTLYSKKYGIDLPRFTHTKGNIIHASTKENDTIRYFSSHDNQYLRYFIGHKKRVISLDMSPIDDTFISSSLDQTVRLWDIRSQNARGLLNCPSSAIVAYEPTGTVFAVGFHNFNRINLYDVNNYDKDPFLHIEVQDPSLSRISFPPRIPFMTSLSFSNNGKYLLVGTSGDSHYLLDAYDGLMIAKLEGHRGLERGKNPQGQPLNPPNKGISGDELSWTPDSKFVVGGSHDGKIIIWDLSEESKLPPLQKGFTDLPVITPLTILDGHPGPSRCVKFNPRFAMMATGGADFALWLPDVSSSEYDDPKKALGKLGLL